MNILKIKEKEFDNLKSGLDLKELDRQIKEYNKD